MTTGAARLLLASSVAALAVLVVGAGTAAARTSTTQRAANACWLQVVNDWLDNNRVDKTYPIPCYTQAIQKLSSYPDIRQYSSAMDDIHRALLAAIHKERTASSSGSGGSGGPSSGSGGSGSSGSGGSGSGGSGSGGSGSRSSGGAKSGGSASGGSGGGGSGTPATHTAHPSVITRLFDAAKPGSAQSIPLPLLVLAGLAVLLLLAAGGTWFARRLQARRMAPARAPAQRRQS